MGRAFRDAGYATASFGKMHWFPYHADTPRVRAFGFDHRVGHFHEGGEEMDGCFSHDSADDMKAAWTERDAHNIGLGGDGDPQSFIGYDSKLPRDRHVDHWVSTQAAAYVERGGDKPMLLVNSQIGPHAPNVVPADLAGMYDPATVPLPPEPPCDPSELPGHQLFRHYAGITRDDLRTVVSRYMAFVTATDLNHGIVIDALKAAGRYDDALIIYMSDHGELLGARGPETMSKYNLYERSIRVPLIIKPPRGMVEEAQRGTRSAEPVTLVDMLPTVLDAADLTDANPVDHLPGRSLMPLLRGEPVDRPHQVTACEWFHKGEVHVAVHGGDWKLILGPEGEELYHLAEDPWEFYNRAADPACDDRRAQLKADLLDYHRDVDERFGRRLLRYDQRPWHFTTD